MTGSKLSSLPGVDVLLGAAENLIQTYGREAVTQAIRSETSRIRDKFLANEINGVPSQQAVLDAVESNLISTFTPSLRPVLNLTGTVLHTNLGRARLPDSALKAMATVTSEYSNLEFDLDAGERGDRDSHIEQLLKDITGAEAATIVNNNAAAVLLTLAALAAGKEVPVSRGELVEIGGSFRIPEVMSQSGCILREIGSTNRTHASDYENAIGQNTGLLMKVHTSNYEINGFTHAVPEKEVADIAHKHQLPLVSDLGSGSLIDFRQWGLPYETTVQDAIKDGTDIVTFSGDKLLGGPQCGIIVGKATLIKQIKSHPLKRALRVDKATIAALSEVLKLYLNPQQLEQQLPTLRDLSRSITDMQKTAATILEQVTIAGFEISECESESQIGSGALPTQTIPSISIRIRPTDNSSSSLDALEKKLRKLPTPVIGRIKDGSLLLDLRTLENSDPLIAMLGLLDR